MDRKAFRNYGAVLASLGAVLSAGCGAESVSSQSSAPTASFGFSTEPEQQAVVVSRSEMPTAADLAYEPRPIDDYEAADDVVGTPLEEVVIEPEPVESSLADEVAVEQIDTVRAEDADALFAVDEPTPDGVTETNPLEPTPVAAPIDDAGPADSEIKFALPSTGASAVADEPTGGEALKGTQAEIRIALPSHRGHPVKRELMPVMVTPREMPQVEQAPDQDPPAVESPLVAAQPVTAAPVPPALEPEQAAVESPLVAAEPAVATPPTPLPPVRVVRSPAFTAAMTRVHERVRHGIQLAEKGALYASRKEFTTAVKMVAQAQDVEQVTRRHTRAVIAGFVALKEANDFVRQNAELGNLDISRIVAAHKTPVLKEEDTSDMPPTVAAGYYFNFAKDRLADAVGSETNGSIALYGLGKIIVAGAGPNSQQLEYTGPAMTLFQAALISEPQNYRASHELGVLLASSGQLEPARAMLINSVSMSPQPVIWQNLAAVHARLGQQQLAQQAHQNANVMRQANPESKAPSVQWVDPATFSRTVSATDTSTPPAAAAPAPTTPAAAAAAPTTPKTNVAKKRLDQWNPLKLRR